MSVAVSVLFVPYDQIIELVYRQNYLKGVKVGGGVGVLG